MDYFNVVVSTGHIFVHKKLILFGEVATVSREYVRLIVIYE